MKRTQKKLLTSVAFISILLLSTGCAPKNANGTYSSAYSYHPYLKHQNVTQKRHVQAPSKQKGFHSVKRIRLASQIGNNIERTAKSLLGTDYKYGANGLHQYDCSSFTQHVFAKQGINLPRVSREQAKRGQYLKKPQLKKGDLIFFDSKKSTRISHVGIYLEKGNFIHASSTQDKVVISNLSSNYYSKHFKWGRRVTPPQTYAMR